MTLRSRCLRRALTLTAVATVALPGVAEAAVLERLTLDTRKNSDTRMAGVKSRAVLAAGRFYVVTVRGTYSEYAAPLWVGRPTCGQPEFRPLFASPSVRNGRVGSDPEFAFALPDAPNVFGRECRLVAAAPQRIEDFQVNTGVRVAGSSWNHPTLLGGVPVKPTKRHQYRYVIQGAGKRVKFRIHDTAPRDNYGRLKISLRKAKAPSVTPAV